MVSSILAAKLIDSSRPICKPEDLELHALPWGNRRQVLFNIKKDEMR